MLNKPQNLYSKPNFNAAKAVNGHAVRVPTGNIHLFALLGSVSLPFHLNPRAAGNYFRQLFPLWHLYPIIRALLSARN
jgi:hypothetical protein